MDFVVVESDAELDAVEEAVGRRRADELGVQWPMAPEVVGPGRFPCGLTRPTPYAKLTAEQKARVPRQRYYVRAIRDPEGKVQGGLLPVDERVASYQGKRVQLPGKRVTIDVAGKVQKAALPKEWKDVLEGKRGKEDPGNGDQKRPTESSSRERLETHDR